MTARWGRTVPATAFVLFALAPATGARELPAARDGDTLGWHVVARDETWQSITRRYLGVTHLWEENYRLNPTLPHPDLLQPGQRVRVIVHRELPPRSAQLVEVERQVEKKLAPSPWSPASRGDRLQQRDGVRTYRRSSAELAFDDGSQVVVTEESLLFLRDVSASVTGRRRQSLEIVEGQADVEAPAAAGASSEIEILIGGVAARPRAGAAGASQTRARRTEGGVAEVMVYDGESEVEAGGARVSVPQGMGTSAEAGSPPRPPERLLPPPEPLTPARRSQWHFANPRFEWRPVTTAASYTLEVCLDAACTSLVERITGLTDTRWLPESGLRTGALHWRVTAVAGSGLDGFPSSSVGFAIDSEDIDVAPPGAVAVVSGPVAAIDDGEQLLLGPASALLLQAHDDASGVERLRYRWDGGDWREDDGSPLRPSSGGLHRLEVQAVDRIGRESTPWSVDVRVDDTPPAPPAAPLRAADVRPEAAARAEATVGEAGSVRATLQAASSRLREPEP